jgi:thioredoxin reductase (NADPH)
VTHELVIVGGGPAGVSAALWARSLGLTTVVLEAGPRAGGQLHHVHFPLTNLAGAAVGDGPALAATLAAQLDAARIEVRYESPAVELDPVTPAVRTAPGDRFPAGAVLVATGVRRRRLEVPGEMALEGRGVSWSATQDRARFAGQDVVVVGGGDGAYENALLLAEVGCAVTLVVRAHARARGEFRRRVAASPRIEVLEGLKVTAVLGEERVRAVRLEGERGALDRPAAGVVVKVGVIPNSEWCAQVLDRDPEGYLLVDHRFVTSRPRVWAVGDVTRPPLAAVAVAVGHGALAGAAIRAELRGD